MTDLIIKIFGKYAMQVIMQSNMLFEIFLCTLLFCWYFKRRKYFVIRFIASLICIFGVALLMAVMRTESNTVWTRFVQSFVLSASMLAFLFVCFDENISEILLCWCGGVSAYQATASIVGLIYAAFGVDDRYTISLFGTVNQALDWFMYYLLHVSLYVAFSFVFSRKKLRGSDGSMRNIVLLSVFAVVFMIVITSVSREYESGDLAVRAIVKIMFATLFLLVLLLRTGIFAQSKYKQDMKIMDELLREEKKQFETVKTNIDIINMKCHDLKHRLNDLDGKLTEKELSELRAAIEIYDMQAKTGCDILDVVLYEKQHVFEREHISMSCIADGAAVGFIKASHLYSIFSNAIGNAVEAVSEIPDETLRQISLNVGSRAGLVEITASNRYVGTREIEGGDIQTSKDDKARHGYGIKSIRYIAEQYGGKVNVTAVDGIFTLQILIPPPEKDN